MREPTAAEDLALLHDAARAAGRIALAHFRRDPKVWDKGQNDPVTEADLAVNAMLREMLRAARPDYGWLSEECADDPVRMDRSRCFVVDPIDGTRAYIAGERSWSHALAVVRDGRPVAGVVHLPALGITYAATEDGPATRDGQRIEVTPRAETDGARMNASKRLFAPEFWRGDVPRFSHHFRPALSYRMCLVAEGRHDAMMTLRATYDWDVAAGTLIAARAGAQVCDASGAALRFNQPNCTSPGVVAANPTLNAAIRARLA